MQPQEVLEHRRTIDSYLTNPTTEFVISPRSGPGALQSPSDGALVARLWSGDGVALEAVKHYSKPGLGEQYAAEHKAAPLYIAGLVQRALDHSSEYDYAVHVVNVVGRLGLEQLTIALIQRHIDKRVEEAGDSLPDAELKHLLRLRDIAAYLAHETDNLDFMNNIVKNTDSFLHKTYPDVLI